MTQGSGQPPAGSPPTPSPVAEELQRILALPVAERAAQLLASDHLATVVPRIAPEELFFTLSEVAPPEMPRVLAHARTEQVEFLLDLDLWKKDRIREERIGPWLQMLAECGPLPLARWLLDFDLADLTLLLGQLVQVRVGSDDDDPLQSAPGRAPFTLDGVYHVSTAEAREPLVRNLLSVLRSASQDLYAKLMEALVRDVNSELEELCFEARQRRLAARGIPEWKEALEVYARLEAERWQALPPRSPSAGGEESKPAPAGTTLVHHRSGEGYLSHLLATLPTDADHSDLAGQLLWLTNKVAVADGLDLSRVDSFETAAHKVAAYTAIGLQVLCGSDRQAAATALQRCWTQHLFRVGWTRIRRLRTRARRFYDRGWPQSHKERLLFLDPPLPEILEGLLMQHPLCYTDEAEGSQYRLFDDLQQVEAAEWALDKSEFLGQFLLSLVDLRLGDLRDAMSRLDTENLKGSTVFLTALVNAALERDFRFAPVDKQAVRTGLGKIWQRDEPPRQVKPSLRASAVEWAQATHPMTPPQEQYLSEFVTQCFRLLEDEFGHLAPEEVPDPRFTRGIWIE